MTERFRIIPYTEIDSFNTKDLNKYKKRLIDYQGKLYTALLGAQSKFYNRYNKYIKSGDFESDKATSIKHFSIRVSTKNAKIIVNTAFFNKFIEVMKQFQTYVSKVTSKTSTRIENISKLTGQNKLYVVGQGTADLYNNILSSRNFDKVPEDIAKANEYLSESEGRFRWPTYKRINGLIDDVAEFIKERGDSYSNKQMTNVNINKLKFLSGYVKKREIGGDDIRIDSSKPIPFKTANTLFNLALKMDGGDGKKPKGYSLRDGILKDFGDAKPSFEKDKDDKSNALDGRKYNTMRDYVKALPIPDGGSKGRIYSIKNSTLAMKGDMNEYDSSEFPELKDYISRYEQSIPIFSYRRIVKSKDEDVINYFDHQALVIYMKAIELYNTVNKS